jgi:hypothetical protein
MMKCGAIKITIRKVLVFQDKNGRIIWKTIGTKMQKSALYMWIAPLRSVDSMSYSDTDIGPL